MVAIGGLAVTVGELVIPSIGAGRGHARAQAAGHGAALGDVRLVEGSPGHISAVTNWSLQGFTVVSGASVGPATFWQDTVVKDLPIPHMLTPRFSRMNPFSPQLGPQLFLMSQ